MCFPRLFIAHVQIAFSFSFRCAGDERLFLFCFVLANTVRLFLLYLAFKRVFLDYARTVHINLAENVGNLVTEKFVITKTKCKRGRDRERERKRKISNNCLPQGYVVDTTNVKTSRCNRPKRRTTQVILKSENPETSLIANAEKQREFLTVFEKQLSYPLIRIEVGFLFIFHKMSFVGDKKVN